MKRLCVVLCLFCVVFSLFGLSAYAVDGDGNASGNTSDTSYYRQYITSGSWMITDSREKATKSKVYIYPAASPGGYGTKVQTWAKNEDYDDENFTSYTTVVAVDQKKNVITNRVYEDGYGIDSVDFEEPVVMMWLRLTPQSSVGLLTGYWSPDWSGNTEGGVQYL